MIGNRHEATGVEDLYGCKKIKIARSSCRFLIPMYSRLVEENIEQKCNRKIPNGREVGGSDVLCVTFLRQYILL